MNCRRPLVHGSIDGIESPIGYTTAAVTLVQRLLIEGCSERSACNG